MRFAFLMLLVACTGIYGQEDSLTLDQSIWHVEVDALTILQSSNTSSDNKVYDIMPGWQTQPDRLLDNQTSAYIKSYGLGSLATISLWGGNASQTLITWEDVPITNPMLGLTDLSLLTGFYNQSLSLDKGGASANRGSGAITGVVDVSRQPFSAINNNNGWHVGGGMSLGSFDAENYHADASISSEKARVEISGFLRAAENNFSYIIGSNELINTNADISSMGLLLNADYQVHPLHKITLDGWLQETEKGIPPTTTQTRSVARQYDRLNRFRLGWIAQSNRLQWQSTLAFLDEHNNFQDDEILLDARNRFTRLWYQGELSYKLETFLAKGKYEFSQTNGFSDNFLDGTQQLTVHTFYGNLIYFRHHWKVDFGLRNEWNSITRVPLIPAWNISYNKDKWGLKAKWTKEFRAPTLNEIFWQPGGNPELSPERGWNQELQFYIRKLFPFVTNLETSLYHRRISDWILWAPVENTFIWRPFNIGLVRSYGLDLTLENETNFGEYKLTTTLGYNYTRSENLNQLDLPKIEIGDQLIYTPRHQLRLSSILNINGWEAQVNVNHTGQVVGVNENLDGYTIVSANVRKLLSDGIYDGSIYVELENILNADFRVIERRPMPGRYITIGTRLTINKFKEIKDE